MQTDYFHLTSIKLDIGSIINPGNWGRLIRRYQRLAANNATVGDGWLLSRELIFEAVRLKDFADRPSRWHSAFCCLSLPDAIAYQARTDLAKFNVIYRVQLVDVEAPSHQGPFDALDFPPPGGLFVESTENLAAFYWKGHPDGQQELVTESKLRVMEICS